MRSFRRRVTRCSVRWFIPARCCSEEFLRPLGLRQSVVTDELGISRNRLNEFIPGERSVTADTAICLERRFKMPARFCPHVQAGYDLQTALNDAKAARRRVKQSA